MKIQNKNEENNGFWLISVNMGYGHQRTVFPLSEFSKKQKAINANDYPNIAKQDRNIWEAIRKFYEFISNFYRTPFLGKAVFAFFDKFQKIFAFYPKRDLSRPNIQLKQTINTIRQKKWGKHLIDSLGLMSDKKNSPFVTSFFTPAFMAESFNYPGEIFCIVCDADISRTWAPFNSKNSKIKYFAPTQRVAERLKLYGVKKENIFFTGYPLPLENIGGIEMEILKKDLQNRLINLDPENQYCQKYKSLIDAKLGNLPYSSDHILTLMFAVGGAGAQKEIGIRIVKSLEKEILEGKIKIILSAGIKEKVKEYFEKQLINLKKRIGVKNREGVEILFCKNIQDYFYEFNLKLRKTDVLWTKPSEISFYSALGIPIIIAPTIGSQEEFNERWLLKSGFGIIQENPIHTAEWLFDWLNNGYLAEAAMQGFVEGEQLGTLNILKILKQYS